MRPGFSEIDELAAGPVFGAYVAAFPDSSADAGSMLRVAVQIGQVERYEALLERALLERRPVSDEQWHGLCAAVPWPRALPAWARNPPEPVVIDGGMTPELRKALAWPSDEFPRWLQRVLVGPQVAGAPRHGAASVLVTPWPRAVAVAVCAALLGAFLAAVVLVALP